jgi:S-methylmethionine-dependent homocysteine/selenocysteine methylase/RimJ/RimL family protein N-acetyltransferase
MQLAATPVVGLAVHEHLLVREEVAQLAAGVDEVGQLEQLSEADHVAADRDLTGLGHDMQDTGVDLKLREVRTSDLPILFEHQRDPRSNAMAAFPPRDRQAFDAHWAGVMADPTVTIRTILADGEVAGAIQSWSHESKRLVGYWIGRELWGRGIASEALRTFLPLIDERPLYAEVASTNKGSLRVLEKCAFLHESDDGETVVLVLSSRYRQQLPQLDRGRLFVTDGGLETDLIFNRGFELPCFAAFPLLDDADGTQALRDYFAGYVAIARDRGAGLVLDTPTWRANRDWGERLGYDGPRLADVNRRAVSFAAELREESGLDGPVVINGVVGPRGDGYVPGELMSATEAKDYHGEQIGSFAGTEADMVSAITLNYAEEAIGVARAAAAHGLPVVISFTVETDGRLATGQPLGEAIAQVDEATGGAPAYYMVNCAHPTHFADVLEGQWTWRIAGVRANASRMSHAELDEADELDAGNPQELAAGYVQLRDRLPSLTVVGGCCGTDERHVNAVCAAWD